MIHFKQFYIFSVGFHAFYDETIKMENAFSQKNIYVFPIFYELKTIVSQKDVHFPTIFIFLSILRLSCRMID